MKSIRTKFIEEPILKKLMVEFLERKLRHTWIADVNILKSPIETRVYIEVLDPRRVLGRRGARINALADDLKNEFGVENPRINIIQVKSPWLEPRIVAKRVARGIEMGRNVRGVLYRALMNIIANGAIGAEIIAAGKLGAKGAKARSIKVYHGFVPKAGDPVKQVKYEHYQAVTKSGVIGITVRIAPPGIHLPDKVVEAEEDESKGNEGKE